MRTNYFRKQDKQYHGSMSYKLHSPTNDTRDILRATKMLSERVFKKNINFIKAGVMLSDFYDKGVYQGDLFRSMRKPSWIFDTRKCINYKNGCVKSFATH